MLRSALMETRELRPMSVEDYIALDRSSEERWEYVAGEAFAMAGSSPRHNAITTNIVGAVIARLRGSPCFPLVDGQKVETTATRAFHYPDVTVVCGKPRYGTKDGHALTNPTILVEVLSPTTGDYDRGAKFDHYATIPELREYVVVFSDKRRVEHRKRVGDAQWLTTDFIGGEVPLESAGISLTLDELYADLERVEP